MKKLIMNKRKHPRILVQSKRRRKSIFRAASWGLAVLMLTSGSQTLAKEGNQELFSKEVPVYHEHRGNEKDGGLCYNLPVYHIHEGDETSGGTCYQTIVYHVHEGDEENGGPCYQTPVYHAHEGDEKDGGICYSAVYHNHKSTCYELKNSSELGCYILRYEDTDYDDYEGHNYKDFYMSCGEVVHGTNSSHTHNKLVCDREGKIEKYKVTCLLTGSTVVGYLFDCTKTEETIDGYKLSCEKSADYIEKYERSCGRSEDVPVAAVEISAYLSASKESVTMHASFHDRSEGEIFTGHPPFFWYDGAGKQIGTGESLQVASNGTYFVELMVENEDIRKSNLKTKLEISAIPKKEEPTKAPLEKPTSTPAKGDEKSTPAPEVSPTRSPQVTPIPVPVETEAPEETATPEETEEPESILLPENPGPSAKPQAFVSSSIPIKKVAPLYGEMSERPTPTPVTVMKTDTIERKTEAKKSAPKPVKAEPVKMEKQAKGPFFEKPVIKVVTITTSTLLGIACLFFLFWIWRFIILVFNDDGKGTMLFLGLCMLKRREEGYLLLLPKRILEKAITNRYCFKSVGFHLWRKEEEELFVFAGKQKRVVKIKREMQAVL